MAFWEFAHKNPVSFCFVVLVAACLIDAFLDLWRKK